MAAPKASIIIPAYNYGRFLAEAVESALAQDYGNVEVIVVDDGSTDDTPEVCEMFGERILYHYKENAGLSAARNTGIELASGEFYVFLDADDTLRPDMISRCMAIFDSADRELALVACRHTLMDAGGDPIDLRPVGAGSVGAVTTRDLLRKSRFAADAALVRAAAFDRCGGFDEGLTSSEDWDMWIRISCTFSLRKIGARLVNVRVHSGSMSSDAARMNRNMTAVLKKARLAGVEPSAPLRFWDAVFAFKDYQVAWIANGEGEPGKAIGLLLRSIFRHLYFSDHRSLENPRFFRLRALRSFLANALFRGGR